MSSPVLDIIFDVGSAAMTVILVDKAIKKCIVTTHRPDVPDVPWKWVSK